MKGHLSILLINISLRPKSPVIYPPQGLGHIATAIHRAGYSFDFLDVDGRKLAEDEIEKEIAGKKYDVYLMGCIVTGYSKVKKLSTLVKHYHPSATVVVGNTVASSICEIILRHTGTDIAVFGEGEITIVEVLKALEARDNLNKVAGIAYKDEDGNIVNTGLRSKIIDVDSTDVDWSLLNPELYIKGIRHALDESGSLCRQDVRLMTYITSRGCPGRCTFCYHAFQGYKYRQKSPAKIISDVRRLLEDYGLNNIWFVDDLTFHSQKHAEAVVDLIIADGLEFNWRASIRAGFFRKGKDEQLAEKFRKAGCIALGFALESANAGILKAMRKNIDLKQFAEQVSLLREAGIAVRSSLVFGYPMETEETISETFNALKKMRLYASAGYLLPQPGSWAYQYGLDNGYISDEESYLMRMGDRQDLHVNFTAMADETFQAFVRKGFEELNALMGLGLDDDHLIKTRYKRISGEEK